MELIERDRHFDRLSRVVCETYKRHEPHRKLHREITQTLKGQYYPHPIESEAHQTSINLLSMAYRALSRHVISKAPRLLATPTPNVPQLRSWAENAEQSANIRIQTLGADRELAEVGRQSMVSYGTLFMAPVFTGKPDGMELDLVVRSIPRHMHFFDLDCTCIEDADFQGHIEEVPLYDVLDNPLFDESVRKQVQPQTQGKAFGEALEKPNQERNVGGMRDDLYDYVRVFCVYERRRGKLYYFPVEQPDLLLAEIRLFGPEHGPYRYLYYERPPNSPTPISPLMHLMKKHRAFNFLDVKAIHQQQRSKSILAYTNASAEEAKKLIKAVDSEALLQENGALRWLTYGGASQGTVAMAEMQRRDFSYAAGNLEAYMGLSQQADTLGQERLLAGAANAMLEDMADYAEAFIKGFCEDLYWYDVREDSEKSVTLTKQVPGTSLNYSTEWTREHRRFVREHKFEIAVEPYSYVTRSPQARLADLLGALQIYMGFADQAMAQGITLDVEGVVRHIAKLKNLPELYDVLILNQSPEQLSQLLGGRGSGQGSDSGAPHRYIRESRSDGSGADMEMLRMFGNQNKEEQVA